MGRQHTAIRRRCAGVLLVLGLCCSASMAGGDPQSRPGPLSPEEALTRFHTPDGLKIEPILTEPQIAQPVSMQFDERGRLWVVEYRQYPDPAGLVELSHDVFWRAVYDKVPLAPPNHTPGKDRITIHEDADGDGIFEGHKTFVEGLNIASSCLKGRGGVWVLNPPYLLFYPDWNDDDVPDGDPEVHLRGFGLEDTHSVVNSLTWGPDGWIYAAQGSTVSGDVVRPDRSDSPVHTLGQLIWRYHPETRRYEVFAEGGGNAFGVEIDAAGRVFSGHNGGDTRGFHYVQGGYYLKGFQKHGELSNPYAFGYFPAMKHARVERFTHTFVINDDDALPAEYHGRLFGVEPLQGRVVYAEITPDGSSFQTRDLGHALTSDDPWFRPVDIKMGPEGALYVADFYEGQIAHLRHHEGQVDPSNGRIYRISAEGAKPARSSDLRSLSSQSLVQKLGTGNRWERRSALRLLGDRKDRSVIPILRKQIEQEQGAVALESLWALNLVGGFDEDLAAQTLKHPDPQVRVWTVRLLGDVKSVSPKLAEQLASLARQEPDLAVRSQLASTSRRLPADQGMPIVASLLARSEDRDDIHLPLLLWWAIESRCGDDRESVLTMLKQSEIWTLPIVDRHILPRLMQRFAAEGSRKDMQTCAKLLEMAPGPHEVERLMEGFAQGTKGRSLATIPEELAQALSRVGGGSILLDVRRGEASAIDRALKIVADDQAEPSLRRSLVEVFGEVDEPKCIPAMLAIVKDSRDDELRMTALGSLGAYHDDTIANTVIEQLGDMTGDVRDAAQTLLASRTASAIAMMEAVEAGNIDPALVSAEVVERLRAHEDERLSAMVAKHWKPADEMPTPDVLREVDRLSAIAQSGTGDRPRGKALFNQQCGKCHTLFAEGGQIGPDLTSYRRDDVANLLLHIVNPDAEIREGYRTVQVATTDGRMLAGFLVEQDPHIVVVRGADGRDVTVRRDEVEEMGPVRRSLMPSGLLKEMDDQALRDLFAYLRSSQPLKN